MRSLREITETSSPLYSVDAGNYQSRYFPLTEGLLLMLRESRVLPQKSFAETYGDCAVLLVGRLPAGVLGLGARDRYYEGQGELAIYVPRFGTVQWRIKDIPPAFQMEWYCYGSVSRDLAPPASGLPDQTMIMPWKYDEIFETPGALQAAIFERRSKWVLPAADLPVHPLAKRIKEFLDVGFRDAITLQGIAESLKTHPSIVSRVFKSQYGMRPVDYLAQLRGFECQFQLLYSEDRRRMVDIGLNSGFQDVSRFNKQFKTQFGLKPSDFSTS